jgi:hypothetical protein
MTEYSVKPYNDVQRVAARDLVVVARVCEGERQHALLLQVGLVDAREGPHDHGHAALDVRPDSTFWNFLSGILGYSRVPDYSGNFGLSEFREIRFEKIGKFPRNVTSGPTRKRGSSAACSRDEPSP